MFRWAAWQGALVFPSQIISAPEHSLIEQSRAANKCKTAINADGFGLAWYDRRPAPGLYRDVYPAWSDPNLMSLATQVQSGLFLAHVRASTGTATSRNNCHPFVHANLSFMHNGQIGGFDRFRKSADMLIPDELYAERKGATDSEAFFLIACGFGLPEDPRAALAEAVGTLEAMSQRVGNAPHMRIAAAFSEGESLYAVRYASDALAPSLFYQWNASLSGWAVVSEPYEADISGWHEVPKGSICRFTKDRVEIEAFSPRVSAQAAPLPAMPPEAKGAA